jgi:hypothetical protein
LADVDVHSVTIPFHAKKLSLSGRSLKQRGGRVREKGGGWVLENHCLPRGGTLKLLLAGICKKFGKVFEKS